MHLIIIASIVCTSAWTTYLTLIVKKSFKCKLVNLFTLLKLPFSFNNTWLKILLYTVTWNEYFRIIKRQSVLWLLFLTRCTVSSCRKICTGGVMVSVLASSAVDLGFESYTNRVKPKIIKLVFVASPLSTQHQGEIAKTGWLGIRIMCPSGATCLPADLFQWASTIKIKLGVLV